MDPAEAALCAAEAVQAVQSYRCFLDQPRRAGTQRPATRGTTERLVVESRKPACVSRDGLCLVQDSRTRQPFKEVCRVTSVEETAVYGSVRTVVWEDGGREPPPTYPIRTG